MGVVNVTPDSFSDGGVFFDADMAAEHAMRLEAEGAAVIDIGPESTRPGASDVPFEEQAARVLPVLEKLRGKLRVPVSIDTRNSRLARAALEAGASIINDVSALSDPTMARLAAERRVPVVLMHMLGEPGTMQRSPAYRDVVGEVLEWLLARASAAEQAGVEKRMIFIDPGIGFGKTCRHNLELLGGIERFARTGYRVLVGVSRKSFIGELTGRVSPSEREFGTAAAVAACAASGAAVLRVHDVAAMADVIKVTAAIASAASLNSGARRQAPRGQS